MVLEPGSRAVPCPTGWAELIKGLNARGIHDIIAVDDMTQGDKFRNIADLQIADYVDADVFYDLFAGGSYGQIEAVFHEIALNEGDAMEAALKRLCEMAKAGQVR